MQPISIPEPCSGVVDVRGVSGSDVGTDDFFGGVVEGEVDASHADRVKGSVTEAVVASSRPDAILGSLLEGVSGGPGNLVATCLGGVQFQGPASRRGVKRRRTCIPTAVEVRMGQKFVEQHKAAHIDIEKRQCRAAASQDPNTRSHPSSVDTPEDKSRAEKYKKDRNIFVRKEVNCVTKSLKGDTRGWVMETMLPSMPLLTGFLFYCADCSRHS